MISNIQRLLSVDADGHTPSYFVPVPDHYLSNHYDLYLDTRDETLVVRRVDVVALRRRKAKRVVAANITKRTLATVSQAKFEKLRTYREVRDEATLRRLESELALFVEQRNDLMRPYFGALRNGDDVDQPATGHFHKQSARNGSDAPSIFVDSSKSPMVRTARHISAMVAEDLGLDVDAFQPQEKAVVFNYNIANSVTEDDLRLINAWQDHKEPADMSILQDVRSPAYRRISRLVNARLAERSVIEYLEGITGVCVRDISLGQISSSDTAWKTHDIDAGRPIDVKNTTLFGDGLRQTFVDRLKRSWGTDVAIAGVATKRFPPLSPYDSKRRLHYRSAAPLTQRPDVYQLYLGELTSSDLEQSKSAVNALPNRECEVTIQLEEKRYPFWAFELDEAKPDYANLYGTARGFVSSGSSAVCMALASRVILEDEIFTELSESQQSLVENLHTVLAKASFTKRTLCIFFFSEFINAAIRRTKPSAVMRFAKSFLKIENFASREYFDRSSKKFNPRGWISPFDPKIEYYGSSCGGLYDPLASVDKVLTLLEICGKVISDSEQKFVSFDAQNPYVLLGKSVDGRKLTIFAYCGGKLKNGNDCDKFPLSIATHKTCDACGKLVCDECGYCSRGCNGSVS